MRAQAPVDPMMRHAQMWKHISGQKPEDLQKFVALSEYSMPIMGALANKPDVKPKDVIKAVANAVAAGKMEASKAMATITSMPSDDAKLRGWLRERYADALSATVHAKAMLMGDQPQQGSMPGMEAPPPGVPQGMPVQGPQGNPQMPPQVPPGASQPPPGAPGGMPQPNPLAGPGGNR